MISRCSHCGVELEVESWMVGKTLECPACHQTFVLQQAAGSAPVAEARPFRPFAAQPVAQAQPRALDPGGLGMPLYMRDYGRVGVSLFGLLLMGLFFVPLGLDAEARPVFWWHYAAFGLPVRAFTVAIVLLCLGAIALLSGIFARGPLLGALSLGAGLGGALTWYFAMRALLGHLGDAMPAAAVCLLVGIPVAMVGLRLRAVFERGLGGRLWIIPGLALLALGCLLPVAGRAPAVESLRNIKVDPMAGVYIGAALAEVFGLISLLPGAASAAMMGYTGLVLGVLSPFVRVMVQGLISLQVAAQQANGAALEAGEEVAGNVAFSQVLSQVLLPVAEPMLRVMGLLMLTVFGGVLVFGAVTWRPKAPTVPLGVPH